MQKTIIIALLVASAICVQVNVGPFAVPTAGYAVSMGVIQKCHRSCLTCSGPETTECLTCFSGLAKTSTGTCGCVTATDHISAVGGALICEATGTDTATAALCEAVTTGAWTVLAGSPPSCQVCGDICGKCAATLNACANTADGCWAGLTGGSNTCAYVIGSTRIIGNDQVVDQTGAALSLVNGYFYTATGFMQEVCAKGCLTCTAGGAAGACATCAAGFALNTATPKRCECPTAGFFHTVSTTAFDTCTACATGAATCTSLTVDVTCTDTSHSANVDSTDSSIVKCGTPIVSTTASSTDSSASSTDGESSATTTSATDAASTSGVLITAASMLLAVILA